MFEELEYFPDPLTGDEHDKLDAAVLADAASDGIFGFAARNLIQYIVQHSHDELGLDTKYQDTEEVRTLLRDNPGLTGALQEAWDIKSFRQIRNVAILKRPSPVEPPVRVATDDATSFTAPYRGAAVDAFYEYLCYNDQLFDSNVDQYYAKFCSIVQSSGTGKSRLMMEMARKDVLVLYVNLRADGDSGYPPRDHFPADVLTRAPRLESEYSARCCAFFAAIFTALTDHFTPIIASESPKPQIIQDWNEGMCQIGSPARMEFFARVQVAYDKLYKSIINKQEDTPEGLSTTMQKMSLDAGKETSSSAPKLTRQAMRASRETSSAASKTKGKGKTAGTKSSPDAPHMPGQAILTNTCENAIRTLRSLFPGYSKNHPALLLAFDEAHVLNQGVRNQDVHNQDDHNQDHQDVRSEDLAFRLADVFCRAISVYCVRELLAAAAVWVAFASTTSKLTDFSPPQSKHNSARVRAGQQLFPPFTELGWDQLAHDLTSITAMGAANAEHIVRFGRPLWGSLHEVGQDIQQVARLAAFKLCGAYRFNPDDAQALAVLGQRFALEISFGHPDSVEFLESAVASHLRICTGTTMDRAWRFTSYPSEPFLSCLAANMLHAGFLNTLLETLCTKVNNGMVDIGQRGELVSRLLWLLAKDLYVRDRLHPELSVSSVFDQNGDLIDCKRIPVVDFFKWIFGNDFWLSKEVKGAEKAFSRAYVNFSHWVSMTENIADTRLAPAENPELSAEEWTLRHWCRTSAIQCCHGQPRIDKVIPIFFGPTPHANPQPRRKNKGKGKGKNEDENEQTPSSSTANAGCMSHIFISDKARKTPKHDAIDIQTNDPSIQCESVHPYIAILCELGVREKPHLKATYPQRGKGNCLRIEVRGLGKFSFLHERPTLAEYLRRLVVIPERAESSKPSAQRLRKQMMYGGTRKAHNMRWENQGGVSSTLNR